ncbi:hypothetical protein HS088_TW21G00002 [Tripterygium wilfordii]|uniref:Uncharacterized protein n=1 Tax=Tripterygium wilfordii TaxID=458696 RepID=A0A7J7C155_TRIWF|nr:hypothetical protein HS088_TW21G00002 [Tripterygium wilfordii]
MFFMHQLRSIDLTGRNIIDWSQFESVSDFGLLIVLDRIFDVLFERHPSQMLRCPSPVMLWTIDDDANRKEFKTFTDVTVVILMCCNKTESKNATFSLAGARRLSPMGHKRLNKFLVPNPLVSYLDGIIAVGAPHLDLSYYTAFTVANNWIFQKFKKWVLGEGDETGFQGGSGHGGDFGWLWTQRWS